MGKEMKIMEITNEERGNRVITLLDAYAAIGNEGDEGEDYVITDFIADLLHLARNREHDPHVIMRNAMMHFETETDTSPVGGVSAGYHPGSLSDPRD